MKNDRITGRVLLKRETGPLEGLGRDFRTTRLPLLLASVAALGGGTTAIISDLSGAGSLKDSSLRLCTRIVILGLAATFFMTVSLMVIRDRPELAITDRGILCGSVFQPWPEIRSCSLRRTRRGLVVWTRSRRCLRMTFQGEDAETAEALFRRYCSADAFEHGDERGFR